MAGSEPTEMRMGFRPTHQVPAGGLPTWSQPDPALPSGQALDAGLAVQVLDQRADGWTRVLCANGWSAWVDGRRLEPTDGSVAERQETVSHWRPTHAVVPEGAQAWREPDPASAPEWALDPGLEVGVVEQRADGLTRVLCANGWSAWVDRRRLRPLGEQPAPGNFSLTRKLGAGAFATVWLARDEGLDSWVAIKILAENWADDLRIRDHFVSEARILRELNHRYIVRVLGIGERADGCPYFVMDYADAGTLADRISENRHRGALPSAPEVADLVTRMCEGLAVAHAHGVVHRDLKPSNVLFRHVDDTHRQALAELTPEVELANEELLLADFGIARRLEAVTHTQSTMGTVLYMAPEQFAGSGDHRVDIYSAAVLLHEFVTNEPPFPEEQGTLQIMSAKAQGRIPSIRERRPDLPVALSDAIRQALAPDPTERPGSAVNWALLVRRALAERSAVTSVLTCPNGHEVRAGKFCPECGAPTRSGRGITRRI